MTKEGVDGGYRFELKPEDVTLYTVAEAVDANFVSSAWQPGNSDMKCLVASGMAGIMDSIYDELDALCKKRLTGITIKDIDKRIFG